MAKKKSFAWSVPLVFVSLLLMFSWAFLASSNQLTGAITGVSQDVVNSVNSIGRNTAPSIKLLEPSNLKGVQGQLMAFKFKVKDSDGVAIVNLSFIGPYINRQIKLNSAGENYSQTTNAGLPGIYNATVFAWDVFGNLRIKSFAINVTAPPITKYTVICSKTIITSIHSGRVNPSNCPVGYTYTSSRSYGSLRSMRYAEICTNKYTLYNRTTISCGSDRLISFVQS